MNISKVPASHHVMDDKESRNVVTSVATDCMKAFLSIILRMAVHTNNKTRYVIINIVGPNLSDSAKKSQTITTDKAIMRST